MFFFCANYTWARAQKHSTISAEKAYHALNIEIYINNVVSGSTNSSTVGFTNPAIIFNPVEGHFMSKNQILHSVLNVSSSCEKVEMGCASKYGFSQTRSYEAFAISFNSAPADLSKNGVVYCKSENILYGKACFTYFSTASKLGSTQPNFVALLKSEISGFSGFGRFFRVISASFIKTASDKLNGLPQGSLCLRFADDIKGSCIHAALSKAIKLFYCDRIS